MSQQLLENPHKPLKPSHFMGSNRAYGALQNGHGRACFLAQRFLAASPRPGRDAAHPKGALSFRRWNTGRLIMVPHRGTFDFMMTSQSRDCRPPPGGR